MDVHDPAATVDVERGTGDLAGSGSSSHNNVGSVQELDAIDLPVYKTGNPEIQEIAANPSDAPQTRQEPHHSEGFDVYAKDAKTDSESSSSHAPTADEITYIAPGWSYPSMNKWRVLAACVTYFGNGMNDSATGALIPYLESWYGISYAIVSLIFITNAVGFILAAFFADPLVARLGRSRLLMLSELFMIAGYIIVACSPPFAAVVVAYLILGFGNAINLAMNNVFCANLANSTVILGAAHGSYGIGGIAAPIVATSLVSNGIHWARFYLITIGVRAVCFVLSGWSFRGYELEPTTQAQNRAAHAVSNQESFSESSKGPSKLHLLGRALRNKVTIIGAIFIFAYQGAEVSESGWFISYLISDRQGDPAKVGYVTSGFWAGITLGRFVLVHAVHRVGEKRFVFIMGLACIVFQIIAWQVRDVVGDSGESLRTRSEDSVLFTHIRPQSRSLFLASCSVLSILAAKHSSHACSRSTYK
nr:bypass of stop codon protein 6 [Quercus suber]